MGLVHVDTSAFIQFFRKSDSQLRDLIASNRASVSRYVRLELLQGVRGSEYPKLHDVLDGLNTFEMPPNFFSLAEEEISSVKRAGLNVGLVDFLIALEARTLGFALYTHDKVMKRLASEMGIKLV